jgi:hypothetical protein
MVKHKKKEAKKEDGSDMNDKEKRKAALEKARKQSAAIPMFVMEPPATAELKLAPHVVQPTPVKRQVHISPPLLPPVAPPMFPIGGWPPSTPAMVDTNRPHKLIRNWLNR